MLSEHFPPWLVYMVASVTSPIVALISMKVPPRLRAIVIFIIGLGAAAYVAATTALEMGEVINQAIIIFGLATGGYAMASSVKVTNLAPLGAQLLTVVALLVGLCAVGAAVAQTVPPPGGTGTAPPVVQFTVLALLATASGWLARLIRSWIRV